MVAKLENLIMYTPWSTGWSGNELSVGRPLNISRVWCFKFRDFFLSSNVPHLDVPAKVSESGKHKNCALRIVHSHVSRARSEVKNRFALLIENCRLGRHVAIDDAELGSSGGPDEMIYRPVFWKLNDGWHTFDVKIVQLSFAIIGGARLVDFGLRTQDDWSAILKRNKICV